MKEIRSLAEWTRADPAIRERWRIEAVERARAEGAEHGVFITVLDEEQRARGGELAGIPFAVKDNIDVAGTPTTAGSPLLAYGAPPIDAGIVSVLREAGAVLLGKTNMHELAFGITSNNAHFGPVRNPLDPTRTAGGSSGGSAAAVALGIVPFSIGTDTGASITVPASFCGVVGFRPSTGRYPGDGTVNLSWTRDTAGLHTRSVRDARIVDRAITRSALRESEGNLAGIRIGVLANRFADAAEEVEQVSCAALRRLESDGAELVEVAIENEAALAEDAGMTVVLYETAQLLPWRAARFGDRRGVPSIAEIAEQVASPDVRAVVEAIGSAPVSDEQYEDARRALWSLRREYERTFERAGVDLLIGPTSVALPPVLGDDLNIEHNGHSRPLFATLTRNTASGTSSGAPMLSIPAGFTSDGLSVGMMIEGRFFDDERLLQLAELVERSFCERYVNS